MKISDFKGNEAIEILADIMMPISAIVNDDEFKSQIAKREPLMNTVTYILKNHADDVLDMYEPLTKEKREEATPTKIIKLLVDIANDPDISGLFFSQGQTEDATSSGSAMESTEENG